MELKVPTDSGCVRTDAISAENLYARNVYRF